MISWKISLTSLIFHRPHCQIMNRVHILLTPLFIFYVWSVSISALYCLKAELLLPLLSSKHTCFITTYTCLCGYKTVCCIHVLHGYTWHVPESAYIAVRLWYSAVTCRFRLYNWL